MVHFAQQSHAEQSNGASFIVCQKRNSMMEDAGSIRWDHSTRVEQLVYKSNGYTLLHLKIALREDKLRTYMYYIFVWSLTSRISGVESGLTLKFIVFVSSPWANIRAPWTGSISSLASTPSNRASQWTREPPRRPNRRFTVSVSALRVLLSRTDFDNEALSKPKGRKEENHEWKLVRSQQPTISAQIASCLGSTLGHKIILYNGAVENMCSVSTS